MPDAPRPKPPGTALTRPTPVAITQAKRSAKLKARSLMRLVKIAAWMIGAAVVIPVAMITGGWLLGPKGYEGVLLAPMAVLTSWALILAIGLRRKPSPKRMEKADVRALPASVNEWLEAQRPRLPQGAQASLTGLSESLEMLELQAQTLTPASPGAKQLRKLLVDELTPLVDGYRKLPPALQREPLHGGASPETQLIDGLRTLDGELRRTREQLAASDLNSLATHQRYLELKYKNDE